jgi:triosephosphate isomerase
MQKNQKIIVANWKMNPRTLEEAKKIFSGIKRSAKFENLYTVVCPPAVYIESLGKLATENIKIGGQDVFWESIGTFTGQISPLMLKSVGADYVIIGHSEKRELGDTDEIVNNKVANALRSDLKVVLCVGEKHRDSDGAYFEVVKNQIKADLDKIQRRYIKNLIVAYEPVWAIGKNESNAMNGAQMFEMGIFIRKTLADLYGKDGGLSVPVLYGGSVGPHNTHDIVSVGKVDGLLVGHQSLDPKNFAEIIREAMRE